jgi:hypothetical protein
MTSFVYLIYSKFRSRIMALVRKFEVVVVDVTPKDYRDSRQRQIVERANVEMEIGTDGRFRRWLRGRRSKRDGKKARSRTVKDEGRVCILENMERGEGTAATDVDNGLSPSDPSSSSPPQSPPPLHPPPQHLHSRIPTLSLPRKLLLWAFDGDPLYIHAVRLSSSAPATKPDGACADPTPTLPVSSDAPSPSPAPAPTTATSPDDPRSPDFSGTCSVCLDDYAPGEYVTISSAHVQGRSGAADPPLEERCRHVFHLGCYKEWIKEPSGVNCPVCRRRYVGRKRVKGGWGCRRRNEGGQEEEEEEEEEREEGVSEGEVEGNEREEGDEGDETQSQLPPQAEEGTTTITTPAPRNPLARELDALEEIRASTDQVHPFSLPGTPQARV